MNDKDYKVGYQRPPAKHRFKKGQPSPNPAGRPRNSVTQGNDVMERSLNKLVEVRDGDKNRKITRRKFIVQRYAMEALKGDLGAINALMTLRRSGAKTQRSRRMIVKVVD